MQNVEPFEVKIMRAGKTVYEFKTNCTAIIGKANAATLCTSADVALRVALASRLQLYLDSLIETILSDTAGQLRKSDIEVIIASLNAMTEIKSHRNNLETVQELLERLKGDGNG